MNNSYDKTMVLVTLGFCALIIAAFTLPSMMGNLIETSIGTGTSKEENEITHNIQDIEFKGERTFWIDKRIVSFHTDNGVYIYPKEDVTYVKANNDNTFNMVIKEHDQTTEHVIVNVGENYLKDLRTSFAEQFNINITFTE